MYERRRNIVARPDGRPVNVARFRGQLFICATGCCCGRTEDGFAEVPAETFHLEWERRRLRNVVHLTIGGCLGPCALANVALLLFDGQAQWFHSVNSRAMAVAIYDHVEEMLAADACLPPPPALAPYHFTASAWQARPDGQPVDDFRPRRSVQAAQQNPPGASRAAVGLGEAQPQASRADMVDGQTCADMPSGVSSGGRGLTVDRVVAVMEGATALPRKNGELVFDEPWQGRAFGMAVALHEGGAYEWEEFRQALIAEIAAAEARGGRFAYYELWLATFEALLARKGLVSPGELDETAYQFEFGERDDVF